MLDYSLPYKTKQFFFVLIKLGIIGSAFYFIYIKLTQNSELIFNDFVDFINNNAIFSIKSIVALILLSFLNWFFEILKWQHLVSVIQKTGFKKAAEQSLGALTASLITPNRIGEYGAKALYFTASIRKRVMLINLLSNMFQMAITCTLGFFGLYYFISTYKPGVNLE